MTVGDLVAMRQLGCDVIAGSAGLDRQVVWAHACELDDPWNWLTANELLMTTGICIPAEEDSQVMLIRNLCESGIAAIAIGDDLKAPPLHPAMLHEADVLNFPVVTVTHATPFSAMGRTVAVAAQSEQISRIARLSRLYDVARSASITTSPQSSLLEHLSKELGYQLHVLDVEFGTEPIARTAKLGGEVIDELRRHVANQLDQLPPRLAVRTGKALQATAFSLPTHRKCMLVVEGTDDLDLDAFVLLHAQSLVAVEMERETRDRERTDELGTELFQQIFDGTIGSDAAHPLLRRAGFEQSGWLVLGFDARHLRPARLLAGDNGIPNLSFTVGEEGYLLISENEIDKTTGTLGPAIAHLGVSARTADIQRVPDSVRQSRWALQAALADNSRVAEYSTAAPLFLPRTLSEAHLAARAVLGELMDHDAAHGTHLIATLEEFLAQDRSWTATAKQLVIHRQTLGYRLKKIEALSGRSLKSSADIAILWMALVGRRISRGPQ
jgi:purine catabolism regulator